MLLKKGTTGDEVKLLQKSLLLLRYDVGLDGCDGVFGQETYKAVLRFQRDHALTVDGIVGMETWVSLCNHFISESEIDNFVAIAELEYANGFKHHISSEGVNLTAYGEWYGINGEPWCAIFVSWCAYKAGILNVIVPKYYYCADGVKWYKEHNRYKEKESGYIPLAGDIIMFESEGNIYHTGIVVYYDNEKNIIHTVEGNVDNTVEYRTHRLNSEKIHGYGVNSSYTI